MKTKSTIRIAALSVSLALTMTAQAANQYFDAAGGTQPWDGSANWANATGGPYTSTWSGYNFAYFEGTGGIVNVGSVNANGILFTADGYTLSGGTIGMGSPVGGPSITVNTGLTAAISGSTFTHAGGYNYWNKDGAGTLNFSGTDNSSDIAIKAGTLGILTGANTSISGVITVGGTVNTNATLNLSDGTVAAGQLYVGRNSFGTTDTGLGTLAISGGSMSVTGANFIMGQTINGTTKTAQFTQSGGVFTYSGGWVGIGNGGGVSQLDLSGGSFTSTTAAMLLGVRSSSTLNISGNAVVTLPSLGFFHSNGVTGSGKTSTLNLNGGTLVTGSISNNSAANTSIANFNGGTLKAKNPSANFLQSLTSANVKSGGAIIDTNTFDITIGQALLDGAGGGGLTKMSAGTLTLSAASTYTGATTVNAGTLKLSGGTLASSAIIVGAAGSLENGNFGTGQTIRGSGTLTGSITIASGATLSPVDTGTIGTLTATGNLSLAGTTIMDINKAGASFTSDEIVGTGSAVLGGNLTLHTSGDTLTTGDTFTLFANSIGISGDFTSITTVPSLPAGLSWDTANLPVNGTITVVARAATPFFNPPTGGYVGTPNVTITSDSGSTIHYTMDGTNPHTSPTAITAASPATTAPLNGNTTSQIITAYATVIGSGQSLDATVTYSTVTTPTWNIDEDGNWSQAAKWLHSVIPDAVGVTADFHTLPQGGNATVTLDSSRTVGSMVFGNTNDFNWTIANSVGNFLTLDAGGGTPTVTVLDNTATLAPVMVGSHGLTKAGDGTLALSGANTYSGGTTVAAGTLKLAANNVIPHGSGKGHLSLTGTLDMASFSDTINGLSGNGTVDNSTSGAAILAVGGDNATSSFGGVMQNTAGTLSLTKIGSGTLTLTNHHTYTGTTSVNGGTLEIPSGASINSNGGRTKADGGTLKISGGDVAGIVADSSAYTFLGDGAASALEMSAGSLSLSKTFQYWDIIVGNFAPATWNQTGGVAEINTVSLYMGNNPGSGGTALNVSGGSLAINGTGGITGRQLVIAVRANASINISGTADVTLPTIKFGHSPGVTGAGVTGSINLDGGTLNIESASKPGGGTALFNFNGGTLRALTDSTNFMVGLTTANVRNGGALINTDGKSVILAQNLIHSTIDGDNSIDGGLVKSGTGTLTLTGTNNYTGATVVNAGTLAGSGNVASDVTVKTSAVIAPGNGIGTFGSNQLTFETGSVLAVQLDSSGTTACDKLDSYGNVVISSGVTLHLADIAAIPVVLPINTKFDLIDYSGLTLTGKFDGLDEGATIIAGMNKFTISYADADMVTLTASGGTNNYLTWATTNAPGQAMDQDFDNDGVANGIEYFMGLSGSGVTANPSMDGNDKISWTKGGNFTGVYGTDYVVQTSSDLKTWVDVLITDPNLDNGSPLEYTLTGVAPRFVRLKVTGP